MGADWRNGGLTSSVSLLNGDGDGLGTLFGLAKEFLDGASGSVLSDGCSGSQRETFVLRL